MLFLQYLILGVLFLCRSCCQVVVVVLVHVSTSVILVSVLVVLVCVSDIQELGKDRVSACFKERKFQYTNRILVKIG